MSACKTRVPCGAACAGAVPRYSTTAATTPRLVLSPSPPVATSGVSKPQQYTSSATPAHAARLSQQREARAAPSSASNAKRGRRRAQLRTTREDADGAWRPKQRRQRVNIPQPRVQRRRQRRRSRGRRRAGPATPRARPHKFSVPARAHQLPPPLALREPHGATGIWGARCACCTARGGARLAAIC